MVRDSGMDRVSVQKVSSVDARWIWNTAGREERRRCASGSGRDLQARSGSSLNPGVQHLQLIKRTRIAVEQEVGGETPWGPACIVEPIAVANLVFEDFA